MQYLALRKNYLSGLLPDTWNDLKRIQFLDLAKNKFSGEIPKSIGNLEQLRYLTLNENQLQGKLPSSLQNCTNLEVIDLGETNLSGYLPLWIGEKLSSLKMLRLRSNLFIGPLPQQLCHLLIFLDFTFWTLQAITFRALFQSALGI